VKIIHASQFERIAIRVGVQRDAADSEFLVRAYTLPVVSRRIGTPMFSAAVQ
jgi:hypothetical protein